MTRKEGREKEQEKKERNIKKKGLFRTRRSHYTSIQSTHLTLPELETSQQSFYTPGCSPRQWNTVDLTGPEHEKIHSTLHQALSAKLQRTKMQPECREAEWKDGFRMEPFLNCLSSASPSSLLSAPASLKSQIHHVLCPSMPLHMLFPLPGCPALFLICLAISRPGSRINCQRL